MNIYVVAVAILLLQRIHITVGDETVRDLSVAEDTVVVVGRVAHDGCEAGLCWDNTSCEWISRCDGVVGEECGQYNALCKKKTLRLNGETGTGTDSESESDSDSDSESESNKSCTADSDCSEETEYCAQGTCLTDGRCLSSSDCINPNNFRFQDIKCMGYQYCAFTSDTDTAGLDRVVDVDVTVLQSKSTSWVGVVVGHCTRKCGAFCEQKQQERTRCSVTGCSDDTITMMRSRCPGIVSCVVDYCDDNCTGIYFDASGSVLTDCTPLLPPPLQSTYDVMAKTNTNTEIDPSLQSVYDNLEEEINPKEFIIHDPSTIITVGDKQLIAVTGKEQAGGYTCGLETWWRKIKKNGKKFSNWKPGQCLFQTKPEWVGETRNDGAYWAPDLDLKDGKLTLLYSTSEPPEESAAGQPRRPTTCVGIARSATGVKGFPKKLSWTDTGIPLTCIVGADYTEERSAIDPSTYWGIGADVNRLFLVTGGGYIVATELDTTTYAQKDGEWFDKEKNDWTELARGPKLEESEDEDYDWVEAAYIHANPETNYYYLFLNWGRCCSGLESTYEIRIGRSLFPMGPFVDKQGNDLMEGGGTLLLKSKGRVTGPGHPAMWINNKGKDIMSFHYYDGEREGASWIAEKEVKWKKNGWPKLSKKTKNAFPLKKEK